MSHQHLELSIGELELVALAEVTAVFLAIGDCIALRGDLGAGKTTFARALIRALIDDPAHDVPSPTFALRQDYESPRGAVAHFDFYRIANARDLDELGFDEALATAITVVEWPERAETSLPPDRIDITIAESSTPNTRAITMSGQGAVAAAKVASIADRFRKP